MKVMEAMEAMEGQNEAEELQQKRLLVVGQLCQNEGRQEMENIGTLWDRINLHNVHFVHFVLFFSF